jgi:hypothetical protein
VTVHGERKLDVCNEMEENYLGCSRKKQSRADATDCLYEERTEEEYSKRLKMLLLYRHWQKKLQESCLYRA